MRSPRETSLAIPFRPLPGHPRFASHKSNSHALLLSPISIFPHRTPQMQHNPNLGEGMRPEMLPTGASFCPLRSQNAIDIAHVRAYFRRHRLIKTIMRLLFLLFLAPSVRSVPGGNGNHPVWDDPQRSLLAMLHAWDWSRPCWGPRRAVRTRKEDKRAGGRTVREFESPFAAVAIALEDKGCASGHGVSSLPR